MPSTTVLVVVCFRRRLDRWGSATDCLSVHYHLPEPCVLAEPVVFQDSAHPCEARPKVCRPPGERSEAGRTHTEADG